jgi:hypothetical protein
MVCYVVKNFAKTVGIEKVDPTIYVGHAPGSVTLRVESSSRSNFCSGMSRCRPQSATLVASRKSRAPLMTALASSRNDRHEAPPNSRCRGLTSRRTPFGDYGGHRRDMATNVNLDLYNVTALNPVLLPVALQGMAEHYAQCNPQK